MSDTVAASLISVIGMVVVAGITSWIQYFVTRTIIKSERARISEHLRTESSVRRWESKFNRLADLLGEFIAATEMDTSPTQESWLPLLHKIQFLLQYGNGPEQRLNGAINEIGYALQGIKKVDKVGYLRLQSELAEAAKAIFAQFHHAQ